MQYKHSFYLKSAYAVRSDGVW